MTALQQVDSGMDMTSESTPFTSRWEDAWTGDSNVEKEQMKNRNRSRSRTRSRRRRRR